MSAAQMSMDQYNPARDATPAFFATVAQWLESSREVFVVLRYLRCAGAKDYSFINDLDSFRELVTLCPTGTDIVVFKERQLPYRGYVNEEFISAALQQIANGKEYLLVNIPTQKVNDPRCLGRLGDSHADLIEDLNEFDGKFVAVGICPRFIEADDDVMISASKGGIDGPR